MMEISLQATDLQHNNDFKEVGGITEPELKEQTTPQKKTLDNDSS
jgi:hypothetical protein